MDLLFSNVFYTIKLENLIHVIQSKMLVMRAVVTNHIGKLPLSLFSPDETLPF